MKLFSKIKNKDKKEDRKKREMAKSIPPDIKDKSISTSQPISTVKSSEGKKRSMKELYSSSHISTTRTGESEKKKKERKYGDAYRILIKPLVTEKAANLGSENKYVFAVEPSSNKIEIAKAVNEIYGIKPINVNIIKMGGKNVRYGRIMGKRKDWKKAVVTLPAGKSIKIYEGV